MKPIIGIILRNGKSESKLDTLYLYQDINHAVFMSGGIPIGIDGNHINDYLTICDGFIIPGGDEVTNEDLNAIKEINSKNIPLLGICLGMQEIGYMFDGCIKDIPNHKIDKLHDIMIVKDSLLYKILNCEKTLVNSRHKSALVKTNLSVSAISDDNIIEAIEDKSKKFLLGVEWHPENMYDKDLNSRKIFDYFIKVCNDNIDC